MSLYKISSEKIIIIFLVGLIIGGLITVLNQVSPGDQAQPTIACEIKGDSTISDGSGKASGQFCTNALIANACRDGMSNFNSACESSCNLFEKHSYSNGEDLGTTGVICNKDVDQKSFRIKAKDCDRNETREGFPAVAVCTVSNVCNCDP